ncbi:hypothetical protein SRHO_G00276110 [Serrasalmus rhombeus]
MPPLALQVILSHLDGTQFTPTHHLLMPAVPPGCHLLMPPCHHRMTRLSIAWILETIPKFLIMLDSMKQLPEESERN